MLSVRGLHAYYGNIHVLHGVDLDVAGGHITTILGRNGSGRSTTCKAIMGILKPARGEVKLNGENVAGRAGHDIARAGIGYVPEERLIFATLTVEENLQLGMKPARSGVASWTVEELYAFFPRLKERRRVRAGYLSGGEQQMLTIFRTLLGNPSVILVDEPTEGLAPKIVDVVTEVMMEMKRRGLGIVLLEQKLSMALRVTDSIMVMGHGQIVFNGTAQEFHDNPSIRRQWLEVS
ncbi:ATP-binding cassette domain-containing protein [Rhizobium lusitanum]|uniref:ATP-binding cassette domain-containing protein n=1 Tax=Rhizobium lusitanum TaxID=293958 RepID=A0A6L9UGU9_9HYPH|nr:ABC transporter ATP-binding protein [Rhizobium lusitanum]NEI74551.1 ATP-binding cassette domain-containing protein [Rhizobium lusitanum]